MKKAVYLLFCLVAFSCKTDSTNINLSGAVFGTSYAVIYEGQVNFEKQFDSLFYIINKSMSTYQVNSDISRINRNEDSVKIDNHFKYVLENSRKVFEATDGAFDPTIGSVVNAWDFGPEQNIVGLDSLKIDSLMIGVGLHKVQIKNDRIIKQVANTYLDFNAIAKGYAVDVIAEFLETKAVHNYLVEIGGELRCRGRNIEKMKAWTVGIDEPNFDGSQSVIKAITLKDEAMATSGTYRKFKVDENGNRYAHIIDTKTGYPSQTNLLGISVIASECMIADAYATAFKAMGIEQVKLLLKDHPELKVFLIFENQQQELETLSLNGFPEF